MSTSPSFGDNVCNEQKSIDEHGHHPVAESPVHIPQSRQHWIFVGGCLKRRDLSAAVLWLHEGWIMPVN